MGGGGKTFWRTLGTLGDPWGPLGDHVSVERQQLESHGQRVCRSWAGFEAFLVPPDILFW